MEKISKIVPDSGRFQTGDMSKEKPVRAGAPSYGQPIIESTTRQGVGSTLDNVKETYGRIFGPDGEKAKERQNMQAIRNITNSFFNKPTIDEPVDTVEISHPVKTANPEVSNVAEMEAGEEEIEAPVLPQRTLDVRA